MSLYYRGPVRLDPAQMRLDLVLFQRPISS
jgi:hypothetical protein